MRARSLPVAALLVVTALFFGPSATAQDADEHPEDAVNPVEGPEGSVGIGDGIFLTGMVITPPDGGAPRELDAEQAAAFSQAMIAQAYFGPAGIKKDPPADVPVYRVDISGQFLFDTGVLTVYYADDGTTPYTAFPGLVINPEPPDPPPAPENWFMVPPLVKEAFNGTAEVVETTGAASTTTTAPGTEAAGDSNDSDGSSSALPVAVAVGVAIALAAGGVWLVRRRRADDASGDASEGEQGDDPDGDDDRPGDSGDDVAEEVPVTVGPDD